MTFDAMWMNLTRSEYVRLECLAGGKPQYYTLPVLGIMHRPVVPLPLELCLDNVLPLGPSHLSIGARARLIAKFTRGLEESMIPLATFRSHS